MIDLIDMRRKRTKHKKRKLRENLNIGEKVLVLAERIKKKSAPRKFYKEVPTKHYIFYQRKDIFYQKEARNR